MRHVNKRKAQAIKLLERGESVYNVAKKLRVCRSSVYRWKKTVTQNDPAAQTTVDVFKRRYSGIFKQPSKDKEAEFISIARQVIEIMPRSETRTKVIGALAEALLDEDNF